MARNILDHVAHASRGSTLLDTRAGADGALTYARARRHRPRTRCWGLSPPRRMATPATAPVPAPLEESNVQLGMGLGAGWARTAVMRAATTCVVYDLAPLAVAAMW